MMEKNSALSEEVKNIKREHEIQSVGLCEETKMRNKSEEKRVMIDEDKRKLINRLEKMTSNVQKLTNTQLDMMNQLMLTNQELNRKDIKIATLKSKLRSKKKVIERMNKPSEVVKYFKDLMRSPRGMNDTNGLGYNSTIEKGESSKSGEHNAKGKPT